MALTLDDLHPAPGARHNRKRVGRGHGSGRGKTAGRGTKGQKARSGPRVGRGFEGGQLPLQQRMPYKRGFTNIFRAHWEVVNLSRLEELVTDGPITPESLHRDGVTRGLEFPVKILAHGELTRALEIHAHAFSAEAKAHIEARGGQAILVTRDDRWTERRPRTRRLPLNAELKKLRVGKVGGPTRQEALAALKGAREE